MRCNCKNKIKLTKLHFQKHHNHFLVIPYWLLIAVAAVLQKPSKLLPISHQQCLGATWHQQDFCGGDCAFSSLLIFLFLSACSIRSFSSYGILVQQAAHHPRPSTALLKQGLETHSETPAEGWQDFDDVGTILSLRLCKPGWLMKYITFSARAFSFLCPIWSNCLLLNELDEKYAIGDLDPSFTKFGEVISADVLAKS